MKTKVGDSKGEVFEYVRGTNALLDKMLGNEKVFIVNGSKGRKPVTADSEQEAIDIYVSLYI